MFNKYLRIILLLIVLNVCINDNVFGEDDIFSVTPAVSFAFYPYAKDLRQESANTDSDINNYGISILMGLKLFKKIGAQLNLKIDDPTFKKMVDMAGYINLYGFILNFDYHYFGGTVMWKGTTPNPIPNDSNYYRGHWNNVSLLFNFLSLTDMKEYSQQVAAGIAYSNFEMPLEYKIKKGSKISNPGFGMVKGSVWGLALLIDTLVGCMDLSPEARNNQSLSFEIPYINYKIDFWFCADCFYGFVLQNAELDDAAFAWMVNANGGVPIDRNITRNFSMFYTDDDNDDKNDLGTSIMKASLILGFQKIWDIGVKSRIGLAIGAELRIEDFFTSSNDIDIGYSSWNIGPVVRFSARW